MRNSYDQRIVEHVRKLTGLQGESLDYVVGAAIATATIGKYPTKVDMYTYLGVSEREMDHISHKAATEAWENDTFSNWFEEVGVVAERRAKTMVYAIAADLVANRYLVDISDGAGRARLFLNNFFKPQQIQSRAAFAGYLIVLEYLRFRERGSDATLPQFLRIRYGGLKVYNNLSAFSEIVAESDPETFVQSDYGFVVGRLRELLEISE